MSGAPIRVLLIDDDPQMHMAVRLMLEPEGCAVECFLTGPQGWDALHRQPPDLLLLDIMLASPSEGFHLAYEMKKDDVLRHVPIIMISSIGEAMGMDFAKEIGSEYVQAEAFLEKPLEASRLRELVHQVVGARR